MKALLSWTAFAASIPIAATAYAGEIADCVFDRSMEYIHNSEPNTIENGLRALMVAVKVCVGHDATPEERAEFDDGINRAKAAAAIEARGGDKL